MLNTAFGNHQLIGGFGARQTVPKRGNVAVWITREARTRQQHRIVERGVVKLVGKDLTGAFGQCGHHRQVGEIPG